MAPRYRLLRKLGEGELAEEYAGELAEGGAPLFVRLFRPRLSEAAYGQALVEAARHTAALGEPGAVGWAQVGWHQGRLVAIRSSFDGYTLGDVLRRLQTREIVVPPALGVDLVLRAANVVAAAHRASWSHGALTPGNVLLGRDGEVRVADFGALGAMAASPALRPLIDRGRHQYRAPEQRGGSSSPAMDVFSLGVIVYELLTGKQLAAGRASALSTQRDALAPPSRVNRTLNARLDAVVMRAIERAATRRFPSAAGFAQSLATVAGQLQLEAQPGGIERLVDELLPNEVSVSNAGPLPISSEFELEPLGEAAAALEEAWDAPAAAPASEPASPEPQAPHAPDPKTDPEAKAFTEPVDESWEAPAARPAPPPPRRATSTSRPRPPARVAPEPPPDRHDTPVDPVPAAPSEDWHAPPPPPRKPFPVRRRPVRRIVAIALGLAGLAAVAAFVATGGLERPGVARLIARWEQLRLRQALEGLPTVPPAADEAPAPRGPIALPTGSVVVESDVPARVLLDGVDTGKQTPWSHEALDAGSHVVTLVHEGERRVLELQLKAGEAQKHRVSFAQAKPAARRTRGGKP